MFLLQFANNKGAVTFVLRCPELFAGTIAIGELFVRGIEMPEGDKFRFHKY